MLRSVCSRVVILLRRPRTVTDTTTYHPSSSRNSVFGERDVTCLLSMLVRLLFAFHAFATHLARPPINTLKKVCRSSLTTHLALQIKRRRIRIFPLRL